MADRLKKINEEIENSKIEKQSKVIDVGEKYEIMTGIEEAKAGNLDAKLLPNLHRRWLPSVLDQGPYNAQLYKNSMEQEFYETFIQPLVAIHKKGKSREYFDKQKNFTTNNWNKKIKVSALGPEAGLFTRSNGSQKTHVNIGEVEATLILVSHLVEDIYIYSLPKVARRFGASVQWVRNFRNRIQNVYGKHMALRAEEHLERQMGRCELMLDTFMAKARAGDPYAAKVVKDFMDKEDQYLIPTIEQLPVKDTEENRQKVWDRLEKIIDRRKIEDKSGKGTTKQTD